MEFLLKVRFKEIKSIKNGDKKEKGIVENKICLGNEREEIKHSTIGKGGSQVGKGDTVNDAMLKV